MSAIQKTNSLYIQQLQNAKIYTPLLLSGAFVLWYLTGGAALGLAIVSTAAATSFAALYFAERSFKAQLPRQTEQPKRHDKDCGESTSSIAPETGSTQHTISRPSTSDVGCGEGLIESRRLSGTFGVPIYWPASQEECNQKLGLTQRGMDFVEQHVVAAILAQRNNRAVNVRDKKLITYQQPNGIHMRAELPLTVWFVPIDGIDHALVFTKKTFAEGGERRIRYIWDLTTGEWLVKKRLSGNTEVDVLKLLKADRAKRGMRSANLFTREVGSKIQSVERIREGDLSLLCSSGKLRPQDIMHLFFDIASDMDIIHKMTRDNVSLTHPSFEEKPLPPILGSHGDLTLKNCLGFRAQDQWRAEVCDLGGICAPLSATNATFGYVPPEWVDFFDSHNIYTLDQPRPRLSDQETYDKQFEICQFYIKNGRARDIWSAGIALVQLLAGERRSVEWGPESSKKTIRTAPLACLETALKKWEPGHTAEYGLLGLKQNEIDRDLAELKSRLLAEQPTSTNELNLLFDLAGNMLKINPGERISFEDMRARLGQFLYGDLA